MDSGGDDKHASVTADDFALGNGLRLDFDNLHGDEGGEGGEEEDHRGGGRGRGVLVKRRKQIAVHAKIQRDLIMRTMENVKITKKWDQASKTIEQVIGETSSRSPSPTKSISGRPKSSSGAMSRQTSLPNISRPHTPSAGAQSRVFRPPSPPPTRTAFKFTKEAEAEAAAGASGGGGPQGYFSPYDQVPEQIRPKKNKHVRSSVF